MSHGSSSTTPTTPRARVPRRVTRLVVDYSDYASRSSASARRAARHAACRAARRRLLSPMPCILVPRHIARHVARLVVDYFTYAARPGASARRAARRRLLRLRHTSDCLGTSRGSLSTISPTLCIRVPRHVARLVTRLVIDYSVHRDFILRPHWLYFSHAVCRDYLTRGNTSSASSTPRAAATSSSGRIASAIHLD
jgi:hypothetical protein